MVEIEQEELERLKGFEVKYNELSLKHEELQSMHNTLKDDYIELSKGQRDNENNKQTDSFDQICAERFGK